MGGAVHVQEWSKRSKKPQVFVVEVAELGPQATHMGTPNSKF